MQVKTVKIPNRFYENVASFKNLETKVTNQNLIHEEIKKWTKSEEWSLPFLSASFVFFLETQRI
jgi:hypothetical protein